METQFTEDRIPPQALDVEITVLSSMLYSDEGMNAALASLQLSDFYDSRHAALFRTIKELRTREPVVLADALPDMNGMDDKGAFIIDIAGKADAVDLRPCIKILRDKAARRANYAKHEKAMRDCYDPEKPIDIFNFEDRIYVPAWDNIPEKPAPILSVNGIKILTPGNLSLVVAAAGTGKSALCEAICTATINPKADTFLISSDHQGMTFYIDTERSIYDHGSSWLRVMRRASAEHGKIFDSLNFQLISTLPSVEVRKQYLINAISLPGLSLLILDGLADFVHNVNDPDESNDFLFWLLSEAKSKGFGIFSTIHPNPTDENKKGRGHLGSEAQRRAESVLCISRDGETGTRTLSMDFLHGKNRNDGDTATTSFKWGEVEQMFVSCEKPETKPTVRERQDDLVTALRAENTVWTFSGLIQSIMKHSKKTEDAAKGIYRRLKQAGKIVQDGDRWAVIGEW